MYVVCLCVATCVCGRLWKQEGVSKQLVVSYLMWVLGIKLTAQKNSKHS